MIPICASNGCGLVPETEVFEALGAFLIRDWERIARDGPLDFVHSFIYKGRVYRAGQIVGYRVDIGGLGPVKLHFDYIREA